MIPSAEPGLSCAKQGRPLQSSSISFGMTLVMAIACGVAAANIYYNRPMPGIMEAAFPGHVTRRASIMSSSSTVQSHLRAEKAA
jgi:hypothetical protein